MIWSNYARTAGAVGAAGTMAGLFAWAVCSTTGDMVGRVVLAALFALPLLFSLIGLLRSRLYTAAWTSMLALPYMGYALSEYLVSGGNPGVWLVLGFSALLFAGSTLYPRLRSREGTAA